MLEEADFEKFRQYYRAKGFDLSYCCSEVSELKEEIAGHHFDSPKAIKLQKRRFGYAGIAYDVAEWQQEGWRKNPPKLREEFFTTAEAGKPSGQLRAPCQLSSGSKCSSLRK